jgi:hypothetical protein
LAVYQHALWALRLHATNESASISSAHAHGCGIFALDRRPNRVVAANMRFVALLFLVIMHANDAMKITCIVEITRTCFKKELKELVYADIVKI